MFTEIMSPLVSLIPSLDEQSICSQMPRGHADDRIAEAGADWLHCVKGRCLFLILEAYRL